MRVGAMAVLIFVSCRLIADAPGLTGTVMDPQQRVITGAKVELTCGKTSETTITSSTGEFAFAPRAEWKTCVLRIYQQGFAPDERTLTGRADNLKIKLKLAPVETTIVVNPKQDRLSEISQTTLETTLVPGERLQTLPKETQTLIHFAEQLAGVAGGHEAVYVDGLPSQALPPAETIAAITVNDDLFSAQYADGDQVRVNIATKIPGRKFRWHFGGISFGPGESNALDPKHHSSSHAGSLGLTGPIPGTPLTFSLDGNLFSTGNPEPVRIAVLPTLQAPSSGDLPTVISRKTANSILASAHYSQSPSLSASVAFYDGFSHASNLMTGGLNLPEAGSATQSEVRELRATINKLSPHNFYESGFVFSWTNSDLHANTQKMGLVVPGNFVAGGAEITNNISKGSSWFLRNSIQTAVLGRPVTAGITVSEASNSTDEQPNPTGLLQFENLQNYQQALINGASTGTWFLTDGNGHARISSLAVAPFIQSELWRSKDAIVRVGLRADYQSRGGVLLSPRFSIASLWHGFVLRAATGIFVQNWTNSTLLSVLEHDRTHLHRLLAPNISLADVQRSFPITQELIISQLSPDFVRSRNWMSKTSVEHLLGKFIPGVEYTWMDGVDLLGSQRLGSGAGWIDLLESNRSMKRHQLHVSNRLEWKNHSFTLNYQWIHSQDNTDGPFSFSAKQNDLRSEWARSSGISPHNVSIVAGFRIQGGVSLTVIESWRSSAPYNVTTGLDPFHNGLYNDRGGLFRNSGNGPAFNSLSIYGYKRIPLPNFFGLSKGKKTYFALGIQAENLLNRTNFSELGSVLGSPLFGQPVAALAGRSLRLWSNIDRGNDPR